MGTLFDQKERESLSVSQKAICEYAKEVDDISQETSCSISEIIKIYEVTEIKRANDLSVRNGDAFDEQIGGIGILLERIATSLERLVEKIDDVK